MSRDVDAATGTTASTAPGDTSAGSTDTTAPGGATSSTAPATTAPDDQVAASVVFGDGSKGEILHGELNKLAAPTRANDEFVQAAYGGEVPAGFEAILLSQTLWSRVLDNELTKEKVAPTDADRTKAKQLLFQQLSGMLTTVPDPAAESDKLYGQVPYLPFIVELQARQIALSTVLKSQAPAGSGFPCASHILVATEDEANAVLADLKGGVDFATEASQKSTDTGSKADGGKLGCVDPTNYVQEFADAIKSAPVGQVVGPVKTQFGFHIILVDSVQADGDTLAQDRLSAGLGAATITVDQRLGTWDPTQFRITPATG